MILCGNIGNKINSDYDLFINSVTMMEELGTEITRLEIGD